MKTLKSYELQQLINTCYEAVEKSVLGEMYRRNKDGELTYDEHGNPMMNSLSYNVFINLISSLAPKNISGDFQFDGMQTMENKK